MWGTDPTIRWVLFFLLAGSSVSLPAHAQSFAGLQIGVSGNELNTNITNRTSTRLTRETGFYVGLPYQHIILPWLYLQTTPNLTQKNYTTRRTGTFTGLLTRNHNNYLQLPVQAYLRCTQIRRWQLFAIGGIFAGRWLSGKVSGNIPDIFSASGNSVPAAGPSSENFQIKTFDEKYTFDSRRDQRWEFGWSAGAGLRYKLNSHYAAILECIYYQSLTDRQKHYAAGMSPEYDQTFILSVGCLYALKF